MHWLQVYYKYMALLWRASLCMLLHEARMLDKEMYWLWPEFGTAVASRHLNLTLAGRYHATLVLNLAWNKRPTQIKPV